MLLSEILGVKDQAVQDAVRKQLREDPVKSEKLILSFMEWLRSEVYLPKITEKNFIGNYIRHCDCNLDEAKKKFENWLFIRYKLRDVIVKSFNYEYFDNIHLERTLICSPKLTPEGYRIGFGRLPEDVNDFDFQKIFNYGLALLEFLALRDECAGCIAIFDLKHLTGEYLGKVDIKLLSESINLVYNTYPVKVVQSHFVNLPSISETFTFIAKKLVGEDILKTVVVHKKPTDLAKCFPKDCLPFEYGGVPMVKLTEMAEKHKKYVVENTELARLHDSLKFIGGLPQHKCQQYSFEDFELVGNIRHPNVV